MLIPKKNTKLIWRALDDGTVIIDPDQGDMKVLNQVGGRAWELVDGTRSIHQIASLVSQDFEVSAEKVLSDLTHYFDELNNKGLLLWQEVDQ
jgi:hypothetical protein